MGILEFTGYHDAKTRVAGIFLGGENSNGGPSCTLVHRRKRQGIGRRKGRKEH